MGKAKTYQSFLDEAEKKYGKKFTYDKSTYINRTKKMKITCNEHKFDIYITPTSHLLLCGCPICPRGERVINKELTQEQFVELANKKHNNNFIYGSYTGTSRRIDVTCKKCGNQNTPIAKEHLKTLGCAKCLGYTPIDFDEFNKRSNEKYGIGRYIINKDEYVNYTTHISIKCSVCNGTFKRIPLSHVKNIMKCPICLMTKGERYIHDLLLEYKYNFEIHKNFVELGSNLYFDFYIQAFNLLIDYDSRQYNILTESEFMENKIKQIEINNNIKNEFIIKNKINIIHIIKNLEFKEIKNKIDLSIVKIKNGETIFEKI